MPNLKNLLSHKKTPSDASRLSADNTDGRRLSATFSNRSAASSTGSVDKDGVRRSLDKPQKALDAYIAGGSESNNLIAQKEGLPVWISRAKERISTHTSSEKPLAQKTLAIEQWTTFKTNAEDMLEVAKRTLRRLGLGTPPPSASPVELGHQTPRRANTAIESAGTPINESDSVSIKESGGSAEGYYGKR